MKRSSSVSCRQFLRRRRFSRLARVRRPSIPSLALVAGLLLALGLAACGGEDAKLLPGETAREITANLDTVKQLAGEGDCVGAESAAQQVGEQTEALEGVDPKLKRALEQGAARLEEVIASCEEAGSEAIAPAEVPTEPEEAEKAKQKEKQAKPKEEGAEEEGSPALPPQANGEGKGLENGNGPPASEEAPEEAPPDGPSGGVSPGAPAGGSE